MEIISPKKAMLSLVVFENTQTWMFLIFKINLANDNISQIFEIISKEQKKYFFLVTLTSTF